jgi:drug/metabolite transporter (DMT)-like permease
MQGRIMRPRWRLMATPRLLVLCGVLVLILFGSGRGDIFGWAGVVLLGLGTFLEKFLRAHLRCPRCHASPYTEAPYSNFPMLRQPLVPLERCRHCGFEFD